MIEEGEGLADGTSTASGVGESTWAGVGSSTGTSTVAGVGLPSAYTLPAATAVDFDFVRDYSLPASTAVNFSFTIPTHATGIAPGTQFGTPKNIPNAVGFTSTNFGTPYAMFDQFCDVTGFTTTEFGTPFALQYWRAHSLGPTARFSPLHYYAFNQTLEAEGAVTTGFGNPILLEFSPAVLDRTVRKGFTPRSTRFGTPVAVPSRIGVVTGFTSTVFGTTTTNFNQADGFTSTNFGSAWGYDPATMFFATGAAPATGFGTPVAKITQDATTAGHSTVFGTAKVRCTVLPTGLHRATRFGLPVISRSDTYVVYGFTSRGKFGHPRSFNQFRYAPTGFCSSNIGSPAATQRHLVRSLVPTRRFGKPTLTRTPSC